MASRTACDSKSKTSITCELGGKEMERNGSQVPLIHFAEMPREGITANAVLDRWKEVCVLGRFHFIFDIVLNLHRFCISGTFRTCLRGVFRITVQGYGQFAEEVTRRKITIRIPGFLQEIFHGQPLSLLLFSKDKNRKILVCAAFSGLFLLRFFAHFALSFL